MFLANSMTPKPMANIEDFIEKNKPQYCRPIIDAKKTTQDALRGQPFNITNHFESVEPKNTFY